MVYDFNHKRSIFNDVILIEYLRRYNGKERYFIACRYRIIGQSFL